MKSLSQEINYIRYRSFNMADVDENNKKSKSLFETQKISDKQNNCNQEDNNFANILGQIRNTFDSTQESECINERSSMNLIQDFDSNDDTSDAASNNSHDDNDHYGDEIFQQSQPERVSIEESEQTKQKDQKENKKSYRLLKGDYQILQNKNNNSDFIYFNELEEKIFEWLDQQDVRHVQPSEKIDAYFENQKKMVSSHILTLNRSINEIDQIKSISNTKQSLLERRKQINRNISITPHSCITLY